ncbi:hypothetical protein ABIE64_004610 [Thalassospira sp. MBR-102]
MILLPLLFELVVATTSSWCAERLGPCGQDL